MTEKTKITLSIAKLVTMFIAIIGFLFIVVSWKAEVDNSIEMCNNKDIEHQELINGLGEELAELKMLSVEIKTDLKWIVEKMQED